MVNLIVIFLCATFFLLSGNIIQFIKRILQIITELVLRLLSLIGIKINLKESKIKPSKQFRYTFPDIKIVKKSRQNIKIKPSINKISLILLILSLTSIIINLDIVSGNMISRLLYNLDIENVKVFQIFMASQKDMDVTLTAVMFSVLSFSASKLISQWKETAKFRRARKEAKQKEKAISIMSSKELLDAAKNKDTTKYQKLKKE